MKNNSQKILLIILGIMIAILVCLGIGKIFYQENNIVEENETIEESNDIDDSIDEDIENVEQNNNLCKNYRELNEYSKDYCKEINNNKNINLNNLGFEEININNIDTTKEFMPNQILIDFNLDKNDEYKSLKNGESEIFVDEEELIKIGISLENNVAYFNLNNEKIKILDNIKNIYIQSMHCGGEKTIDFLSNDGDVYQIASFNVQYNNEDLNQSIKKIQEIIKNDLKKLNTNLKYVDLMIWNKGHDTCSAIEEVIGITNDGKKYIVNKETLLTEYYYNVVQDYPLDLLPNENVKVYPNFSIAIGNKTLDYKFKDIYSEFIILTQDNYLYDAIKDKLVSNDKVNKIYYNHDAYIAVFNDGEMLVF